MACMVLNGPIFAHVIGVAGVAFAIREVFAVSGGSKMHVPTSGKNIGSRHFSRIMSCLFWQDAVNTIAFAS